MRKASDEEESIKMGGPGPGRWGRTDPSPEQAYGTVR